MVTIKDIANYVGVSRGTVDRVLNNRPGVQKETRDLILKAVAELNYIPNSAGKSLSAYKKNIRIAYIYFIGMPLTIRIQPYVDQYIQHLEQKGVSILSIPCTLGDQFEQLRILEQLRIEKINGLILAPMQHPSVSDKLRQMADEGIAIVTIHSDAPESGRLAYVGSNHYQLGRIAANQLAICCKHVKTVMGCVVNFPQIPHHELCLSGFRDKIQESYSEIELLEPYYNYADINSGYVATREYLKRHADMNAMFLECTYVEGICRAVEESGRNITLITMDGRDEIRPFLASGTISSIIMQEAAYQAKKPFDILYDYLVLGKTPPQEIYYIKADVKISETID